MSAEHLKSASITNATATPKVLSNPHQGPGILKEVQGTCTPLAASEANSTFRFCRIPSNARVSQVLLSCADATTGGAIGIGLYDTEANGGAAVDADLFLSAYALTSGPHHNLDVTYESTEYTYVESEKMLWEVLGLSSDPCKEYDVTAIVTTVFDGGPTSINVKVRYV